MIPNWSKHCPSLIPNWSQNVDQKSIPDWSQHNPPKRFQNDPTTIPKTCQSDPRAIPKRFRNQSKTIPKVIPKRFQNDAKSRKLDQTKLTFDKLVVDPLPLDQLPIMSSGSFCRSLCDRFTFMLGSRWDHFETLKSILETFCVCFRINLGIVLGSLYEFLDHFWIA